MDDFVVIGEAEHDRRTLSIGVRRHPSLVPSNKSSVKLIAQYLRTYLKFEEEFSDDRRRLILAVADHDDHAAQLAELAGIARSPLGDYARFRSEVDRGNRTTGAVRNRLIEFEQVVEKAFTEELERHELNVQDITLRLLRSLYVIQTRLEPPGTSDVTESIGRLQDMTRADTPAAAAAVFDRLCVLAGDYSAAGVQVNEARLRRDLRGLAEINRSRAYPGAWKLIDSLTAELRLRTRNVLRGESSQQLQIDRDGEKKRLEDAVRAASSGHVLVVTGDPDVGKSALALDVVDRLSSDEIAILALSLQDLGGDVGEFESRLGAPIDAAIGGMPVASGRLLVIDGAEVVLRGRGEILKRLVKAAIGHEVGVVIVVRADALRRVTSLIGEVESSSSTPVTTHLISGLMPPEITQIGQHFPHLAVAASRPRNAWLFSRPGLVELLLPASAAESLPDRVLSESDVFAAVWSGRVRNREEVAADAYPAERDRALTDRARKLFGLLPSSSSSNAAAEASLRSDGLLLPWSTDLAWSKDDDFASDLVRDFSIANLMLLDGFSILQKGDDRRWALRAALLACQVRLTKVTAPDRNQARLELHSAFDATAGDFGERWSEIPLEAMLTSGVARELISEAWDALETEQRLSHLLRIATQRYAIGSGAHFDTLTPLVSVLLDRIDPSDLHPDSGDALSVNRLAHQVVLLWLFAQLDARATSNPERVRLRELLLADPHLASSEDGLEMLALLGSDLDEPAIAVLALVATSEPEIIEHVVERRWSVESLLRHAPTTLEYLVRAYYVTTPKSHWSHMEDYGIRGHESASPFYTPMAGWSRGPFWTMLVNDPKRAARIIGVLVDHATEAAITTYGALPVEVSVSLPSLGEVTYRGSADSWRWYRGGTGPYPIISALIALERAADQLLDLGESLSDVVSFICGSSRSLAVLGVAFGFLVRHLPAVTFELDTFLADPVVWELELSRLVAEHGGPHIQQYETEGIHNPEYRRIRLQEVSNHLFHRALATRDGAREAALIAAGAELARRGAEIPNLDQAALISWVAHLRRDAYSFGETGGQTHIAFNPPADVMGVVEAGLEAIRSAQEVTRIAMAYAGPVEKVENLATVLADAVAIQEHVADPPPHAAFGPNEAAAGVAATLVVGVILHGIEAHDELVDWAIQTIINSASDDSNPYAGGPYGAQTAAARASALFLLDLPPGYQWPDRESAIWLFRKCCTSPSMLVQEAARSHLNLIIEATCDDGSGRTCRHRVALDAVEDAARGCRIGEFDYQLQARGVDPLQGHPIVEELGVTEGDDLLRHILLAPVLTSAQLALTENCVQVAAGTLRDALLAAYRRSYFAEKPHYHYQNPEFRQPYVARALFETAAKGIEEPLLLHITELAKQPEHLAASLREIAVFLTYNPAHRGTATSAWPKAFVAALESLPDPNDPDTSWAARSAVDGIAALLLTPAPVVADASFGATIVAARAQWIPATVFADGIDRWIERCAGHQDGLNAVASFAKTCTPEWQRTTGLEWAERVVAGRYEQAKSATVFGAWLKELPDGPPFLGESLARFRRIVDGLVAQGAWSFVEVQSAAE